MSMERLTCKTSGGYVFGSWMEIYESSEIKTIVDRLAAYEDTGLDPEEFKESTDWVLNKCKIFGGVKDFDRLAELVEADHDGRCVVLPKPLTVTDMDMIRDIGRIVNNLEDMEAALARKDGDNE